MAEPRPPALDIGGVQWAVIVSYSDGSAVLGAYGPYPTKDAAAEAIPRLQKLPGMYDGNSWDVRPLWLIPSLEATDD